MVSEKENDAAKDFRPLSWDINLCSRYTSIKVATLRKFVLQKRIPYIKCGRKVLFRPDAIEAWLDDCEMKNEE